MVRAYGVDLAGLELAPEAEPELLGPQRGKAFCRGAEPDDILLRKEQVVRAGLDRNVHAPPPRVAGEHHALRAAHVDQVEGAAGLARNVDRDPDRRQLELHQIRGRASWRERS